jgi:adenylate kinase
LDGLLDGLGTTIDRVLVLSVPDSDIVERVVGRRACKACGAAYHVDFRPSKDEAVCDACGGELYQRADDTEDKVRVRLDEYGKNTAPVADYYAPRGVVRQIDGVGEIDEIYSRLVTAIQE